MTTAIHYDTRAVIAATAIGHEIRAGPDNPVCLCALTLSYAALPLKYVYHTIEFWGKVRFSKHIRTRTRVQGV